MKNCVLYGAGSRAKQAYEYVKNLGYNLLCFCDSNKEKCGKKMLNLPVIHVSEINTIKYEGDLFFYITPDKPVFYEIQAMLVREKICLEEQILNYESNMSAIPYFSCADLRRVAIIHDEYIYMCCGMSGDLRNESPKQKYEESIVDTVSKFLDKRKKLLDQMQRGENNICSGCPNIKWGYWSNEIEKIEVVAISPSVPCQLSCIYCDVKSNARNINYNKEYVKEAQKVDVLDILKEFEKRNMLNLTEPIQISAGEITINPNKTILLDYLKKYELQIFTNGIVYDEQVALLSSRKGSFLNISIDAGDRETYKLIKGMDVYDKLILNIRRYKKKKSNMELKYIVLNENCDEKNLKGFLDFCKEIKPQKINISTDYRYDHNKLDKKIINAVIYLAKEAKKNNLEYRLLSTFNQKNLVEIYQALGE